jgi:hypothetical protein
MPFPRKFKELLESTAPQAPDHVWVVYTVCGTERESCGWRGWAFGGAYRAGQPAGCGFLESDNYLRCPHCRCPLFCLDGGLRFDLAPQQGEELKPGIDYEVADMVYVDDDDHAAWEAHAQELRQAEERKQYWAEYYRQQSGENDKQG